MGWVPGADANVVDDVDDLPRSTPVIECGEVQLLEGADGARAMKSFLIFTIGVVVTAVVVLAVLWALFV